jgi:hypothetical protein
MSLTHLTSEKERSDTYAGQIDLLPDFSGLASDGEGYRGCIEKIISIIAAYI